MHLADIGTSAVALGAAAMALRVGTNPGWASTWGTGATWGAIAATVVATRIASRGIASSRETSRVETIIEHRRRAIAEYAEYSAMLLTIRERAMALLLTMVATGYDAHVKISAAGVEYSYQEHNPRAQDQLLEEISALQKFLRLDYMPVHFRATAATSDTELADCVRKVDRDLTRFQRDLTAVRAAVEANHCVAGEPQVWIHHVTRSEVTIASGVDCIKEPAMSLDPEVVRRTLHLHAYGGRSSHSWLHQTR